MNNSDTLIIGFMVAGLIGLFAALGFHLGKEDMKEEAVRTGAAYYDPVSKNFTWGQLK